MADSRQREEWDHTAMIACMLANINRDPRKRRKPFTVEDFHPLISEAEKRERKKRQTLPGTIQDLKALLKVPPERGKHHG